MNAKKLRIILVSAVAAPVSSVAVVTEEADVCLCDFFLFGEEKKVAHKREAHPG